MTSKFFLQKQDLEDYFVSESWLIDQWVGDTLWTWGANVLPPIGGEVPGGQLGTNDAINRPTPVTTFAGGSDWKIAISAFKSSSAIKIDGTLWSWGGNEHGQLATNDTTNRFTPTQIFVGGNDWKTLGHTSSTYFSSAAIKTDGSLWVWGRNNDGQLGINLGNDKLTPVTTFAGGTNWKQVSCGWKHMAAIKTDGTLWVWGYNSYGQLGDNSITNRFTPVTTFAGGVSWKQVSCGDFHTSAIKTDGTLWTWGLNSIDVFFGLLGTNDNINRSTPVTTFAGGTNWKQVSSGGYCTAAIKEDGTLWGWGNNNYGQLGITDTISRRTPVTTFAGGTNWKQVSSGQFHRAAIKTDGTLWNWGFAYYGSLGINLSGDLNGRTTPVTTFAGGTNWKHASAGGYHTMAVTSGTDPNFFIS